MAEFKRYLARTEAWAREVEEPERVVASTGLVDARPGDMIVVQKLRGEDYVYVMTRDDFEDDWRHSSDVDPEPATSESGADELPGAALPEREPNTDPAPAAVATVGTQQESPSPADREPSTDNADEPAPTPTASAPTSSGPGDTAQNVSSNAAETPDVGGDTAPAESPVSGPGTPPVPNPSPAGSAASEETSLDESEDDTVTDAPQPDPTSPTQSNVPANVPGGDGATERGDALTTPDSGGDAGNAPTPNVDNADLDNTANNDGEPVTGEPTPEEGVNSSPTESADNAENGTDNEPATDSDGKTPPRDPSTGQFKAVKATDSEESKSRELPPVGDSLETEGKTDNSKTNGKSK